MNGAGWVAIIGLIGLLIGNVVSYIIARRAKSGKIVSSEASSLWEESASIRSSLQQELSAVRQELWTTRTEMKDLGDRLKKSEDECQQCNERLRKLLEWQRDGDQQPTGRDEP